MLEQIVVLFHESCRCLRSRNYEKSGQGGTEVFKKEAELSTL
jgi:hypothetical protein